MKDADDAVVIGEGHVQGKQTMSVGFGSRLLLQALRQAKQDNVIASRGSADSQVADYTSKSLWTGGLRRAHRQTGDQQKCGLKAREKHPHASASPSDESGDFKLPAGCSR